MIVEQADRVNRIAGLIVRCEDSPTDLSAQAFQSQLEVKQCKETRLGEIKKDGIITVEVEAVTHVRAKAKCNRARFDDRLANTFRNTINYQHWAGTL